MKIELNIIHHQIYRASGYKGSPSTHVALNRLITDPALLVRYLTEDEIRMAFVLTVAKTANKARMAWDSEHHGSFGPVYRSMKEKLRSAAKEIDPRATCKLIDPSRAKAKDLPPPLPPPKEPLQPHRLLLFQSARSQQRSDY